MFMATNVGRPLIWRQVNLSTRQPAIVSRTSRSRSVSNAVGVDLDAVDARVRLGPWDGVVVAELEEALFEFAAGRGRAVVRQHRL
jgi:hypothetical protein